jgi:hypothetical protein
MAISWALVAITQIMLAAPARTEDKTYKVVVAAILASEKSDYVDEKLKCLPKEVQKTEPKLKGFRLERHSHTTLALNQSYAFPLVEDQVLRLSVEKDPGNKKMIGLRVKPPQMGEIFYQQRSCEGFFPIITPYLTKNNERLIIAIKVKCKEEEKEKD